MAKVPTTHLGLQIPVPGSAEPFRVIDFNAIINGLDTWSDTVDTSLTSQGGRLTTAEADIVLLEARVTQRPADLDALAAIATGALLSGDLARVTEGGAIFTWNGSAWVQVAMATFASTATRDTAYAKASGAYLVAGVTALIGTVEWRYAGAWLRVPAVLEAGTFTAVAGISIDGMEGYETYEVFVDVPTSSVANALMVRLRAGGVDDASALYDYSILIGTGAAVSAAAGSLQTSWGTSPNGISNAPRDEKDATIVLSGMNDAAKRTRGRSHCATFNATSNFGVTTTSFRYRDVTAFTGVSILATTGTITGSYYVKGLA